MEKCSSFGLVGRDCITGFEGIIVGHVQYMTGCSQYLLTPKVGENNVSKDSQWYDTCRIVVDETQPRITVNVAEASEAPGGDIAAPTI